MLPQKQGLSFGSRIVDELESRIGQNFDTVEVDASRPVEHFYENRGYKTVKNENLSIGKESFSYKVMEKVFQKREIKRTKALDN